MDSGCSSDMNGRHANRLGTRLLIVFLCAGFACITTSWWRASAQDPQPLDLHSIPISDWLNGGEHTGIPWSFTVRDAYLRIDQRLEVLCAGAIQAKDLNKTGAQH